MADVIKNNDLYQEGIFDDFNEGGREALSVIDDLTKGIKELADITKGKLQVIDPSSYESIVELNKAIADSNDQIELHNKLTEKELKFQNQKLKNSTQEQKLAQEKIKTERENIKNSQLLEKQKVKEEKAARQLNSAYAIADNTLKKLKAQYKDLVFSGKQNESATVKLKEEIQKLDKALKAVDADTGEFRREVGNYTGGIREAFKGTGLFSGKLGELAQILSQTKDRLDQNSKSAQGFGSKLGILSGGLILGAIAALKGLYDASQLVRDSFDEAKATLLDLVGEGFGKLNRMQKSFREDSRGLKEEINNLSQELQDQNEIANDATIGFASRQKAAQKALDFEVKLASKKKEFAERELDIAKQAIVANQSLQSKRNKDEDLFNALSEKTIALAQATDELNDAERHFGEQLREIQQKQLVNTINSLQAAADMRTKILQKSIDDEKTQLDTRAKNALEINTIENKLFEDEIKQFEKILGKKIDGNELLKISNGEVLQQQIDSLDLGDKAQDALIKIINKRQASLLAFEEIKKKIDQDTLDRNNKILELERSISIEQQKRTVEDTKENLELTQESIEKNLDILLKNENVFSRSKKKARKNILEAEKELNEELLNEQTKLLELQRDNEIKNAESTINDLILRNEKIKEINLRYAGEEQKLANDFQRDATARANKTADENIKIQKRQSQIIAQYAIKGLDAIASAQEKKYERDREINDKALDRNQQEIERQRNLAERGLANQLAFEEQQRSKYELEEIQRQKRQERNQLVMGFLKSWAGYAEDDAKTALGKAFKDLAIAKGAEALFLAEGEENIKGAGTEKSDSIPAMLSKGESVVTAQGTRENAGLVTAMNKGNVDDYFYKTYIQPEFISRGSKNHELKELKNISSRLSSLENTVANKKESSTHLNNLGEVITTTIEKGFRKTTTYKNRKPRI